MPYSKEYKENNKDKIRESNKIYYEKNKIKVLQHQKQYRDNNKEKLALVRNRRADCVCRVSYRITNKKHHDIANNFHKIFLEHKKLFQASLNKITQN